MDESMKANVPEKIYVVDATFPDYVDFDGSPINTKRIDDHDIEYIRLDTFIEKAFEFFSEQLWEYIDVKNANCDTFINIDVDKLKEDFKNYMKGE